MHTPRGDIYTDTVVAVDAMGGDNAPHYPVEGAVFASRYYRIPVILVGDEDIVRAELARHDTRHLPIRIEHAPYTVAGSEPAKTALSGKQTSIKVAFELVKKGEAHAVFTAGHTGLALVTAMVTVGRIIGVERPALATPLPSIGGDIVLLDAGANAECKPQTLVQFAWMGSVFAKVVLGLANPRVGLLSNGIEETKGTPLTRKAHEMLKNSPLNYCGYIEGNEIMSGRADVVVADGFSGNLVLKSVEGVSEFIVDSLLDIFVGGALNRVGLALMRNRVRQFRKKIDYTEYGGAPLLGINASCIVGHGRSTPKAIANGIKLAADFEVKGYRKALEEQLKANGTEQSIAGTPV